MVLKLGRLLGKGGDGVVYEIIEDENLTDKVVKFSKRVNEVESYILLNLNHKNLMSAYTIESDERGVNKIAKGDLLSAKNLTYSNKVFIMKQLIEAVSYLHSQGMDNQRVYNFLSFNFYFHRLGF